MSQINYERLLEDAAGSGGNSDLALTIFSGSCQQAFQDACLFYDKRGTFVDTRDITGQGTSADFDLIGDDPVPMAHTPGKEANIQASQGTNVKRLKFGKVNIAIDELIDNPLDIAKIDVNTVHFQRLINYGKMMGRGLARVFDHRAALLGCKGARTAALTGVHQGGTVVYRDDGSATTSGVASVALAYPKSPTGAYNFRADLVALGEALANKSIPQPWSIFVPPEIVSALAFEPCASDERVMPSIYSRDSAGDAASDFTKRFIRSMEGFDFFETLHLPSIDMDGDTSVALLDIVSKYTKYRGNFSGAYHATTATAKAQGRPVALVFAGVMDGKYPLGMVTAGGIHTTLEYDNRRKTTFMDAEMHYGLGTLHPYCCGAIEIYRDG